MIQIRFCTVLFLIASILVHSENSQVATGGKYELQQIVISNGGGSGFSSGGPNYSVEGTIAQSAAGVRSTAGFYEMHSGFLQSELVPTAATVAISGRVSSASGRGIYNVSVLLTDSMGSTRVVRTSVFGYFRFYNVEVGQTYVISAEAKRFRFPTEVFVLNDELTELNITALSSEKE